MPYILANAATFRRSQSTHLADVHSDEIDESVLDQWCPLTGVIEQFAHCDGRGTLTPDVLEPLQVFRGKRILKKEQEVWFHVFRKLHCFDGS